jgi:predicted nucleotidyltransferase component of viral defense system
MINQTSIESYFPESERQFKRAILREYMQCKILELIFDSPHADKVVFLGGTAIRIIHDSRRFSEDLDFDNLGLDPKAFDALANLVKIGLERLGLSVEIRTIHKKTYRVYVKIPDVLFANGISPLLNEKLMIQIDAAPQNFDYAKETVLLKKFDVLTQIFVVPIDLLLSQKILAALDRKRAKGRDFFDVVFLWNKTKPDYSYLEKRLGIDNLATLKSAFRKRISSLDLDSLAIDAEPFLIDPADGKKIRLFREFVESL